VLFEKQRTGVRSPAHVLGELSDQDWQTITGASWFPNNPLSPLTACSHLTISGYVRRPVLSAEQSQLITTPHRFKHRWGWCDSCHSKGVMQAFGVPFRA
jgi:hypothetical protein